VNQYALAAVLLALLAGIVVGKAWERYKLRDGHWVDRRRLRETPHYMLGLNFLTENQLDQAIDELTHAASGNAEALEIQMILGNLYRRKGQVGRAINIHQALLQRPNLTKLEHAYVLLCLGLDYRHGGFVDRALEAFHEVVRLDPKNRYALVNLQKLHEEQQQWLDAARLREQIADIDGGRNAKDQQILAFLKNQIGASEAANGEAGAAARMFSEALDVDAGTAPAYLNLGDVRQHQGNLGAAIDAWERLVKVVPERAYLAFERLEHGYRQLGAPGRFADLCRSLIDSNPQDWRARLALARFYAGGSDPRAALDLLLAALPYNPHGLVVHQAIWEALTALHFNPELVRRYVTLTGEAVFYLDPHVCVNCRYRSTELLWQCPQCHEWNSFVEERIAPAKTAAAPEIEPTES
jgi:lipopolysaccharide biosynthesis regulator YciM